jgi:hypothetical protein
MDAWIDWLRAGSKAARGHRQALDALADRRRAQLEEHIASLR